MNKTMKTILLSVGAASLLLLVSVLATNFYLKKDQGVVEQIPKNDVLAPREVSAASDENVTVGSPVIQRGTVSKEQITFDGAEEDKGFLITRLEAAQNAMDSLPKDTVIKEQKPSVVMYALVTAAKKTYKGYIQVSKEERYYFTVNGMTGEVSDNQSYQLEESSDYVWRSTKKGKHIVKRIDENNLPEFNEIKLDVGLPVDCEIRTGDVSSVSAYCNCIDYKLTCRVENQKLIIEANHNPSQNRSWNDESGYITITVPSQVKIKVTAASIFSGNLKIQGIESELAAIDMSCGNLEVVKSNITNAELQSYSGEIKMDRWEGNKLQVDSSCGNISTSYASGNTIKVSNYSGDIEIDEAKAKERLEFDSSCGNVEISKLDAPKAKITNYSGDIRLKEVSGNCTLEIDNSCGNIAVGSLIGGKTMLENYSGDILIEQMDGTELTADVSTSFIQLKEVKNASIKLNSYNGDIELGRQKNSSVQLTTNVGDVRADAFDGGSFKADVPNGDIILQEVRPVNKTKFDLSTRNGNILIECTGMKSEYGYSLKSNDGSIDVDGEYHEDGGTVSQSGDCMIGVETDDGDIKLEFKK